MILSPEYTVRRQVAGVCALTVATLLAALYVAGYLFLLKLHAPSMPAYTASLATIPTYWQFYGNDPLTRRWLFICLAGGALPALFTAGMLLKPVARSLYGDARFANRGELVENGLFGQDGIILGKWGRRFLMLGGDMGAIIAAPPRSGKGVGIIITNLLSWFGSVVVLDIRQEAYQITAGWRALFSHTGVFNPLAEDGNSIQFNPYYYVRADTALRINDIQKIANYLSPDPVGSDAFWTASCRSLFLGMSLYLFETPGLEISFGSLLRTVLAVEGESVSEHWTEVIAARDAPGASLPPLSTTCRLCLLDFINLTGPTQSSIQKTFSAKLELWFNPLVCAATTSNTIDLRNLRRKKCSIYVGVRPGDLERLRPLLNLFFEMTLDLNMDVMPKFDKTIQHKVLVVLDEMTALGRMPVFASTISAMGGYGVIPLIAIQGKSQLRATYGADTADTIEDCCGAAIEFSTKNQSRAEEISRAVGTGTVVSKSHSRPAAMMGIGGGKGGGGSETVSDTGRALLLPQEIRALGRQRELVLVENMRPIMANKIRYYKEPVFKRRANLPLPAITPLDIVMPGPLTNTHVKPPRLPPTRPQPAKTRLVVVADLTDPELTLDDLDVDFGDIEIPEHPTGADIDAAYAAFSRAAQSK